MNNPLPKAQIPGFRIADPDLGGGAAMALPFLLPHLQPIEF